ncbi:GAP family protein [Knoellia sp. CPCC 206453]|uniref:GAP family protein n=1 Tax=Knoellia pratensis TaxID=3404796 RepID=UPI00361F1D61
MELTALGGLAVLALIDGTSFGTLGVPVWMLVQPKVRTAAVLTYLGVIAGFYWLLGLVLLGGAEVLKGVSDSVADVTASRPFLWVQLVVGVALFAGSFAFTRKRGEARRARRMGQPTRMERWTSRAAGPDASLGTVTTVAIGAGVVEAASMLPYLAAIGLLTTAGVGFAGNAGLLAAYVVVMVVPALVLLGLRLVAHRRVGPLLERVHGWLQRNKDEMLGWVLGIVGFLVASDAVQRLGLR